MTPDRPVVVALGAVDPTLVNGVLGSGISFLAEPSADDLAVAVGAIARADAVVDNAFFEQAPRLRVVARTASASTSSTLPQPALAASRL